MIEFFSIICFVLCLALFGIAIKCENSISTYLSGIVVCTIFFGYVFIPSERTKQNIVKDYLKGNIEVQYQETITDSRKLISRDTIIVFKHKD